MERPHNLIFWMVGAEPANPRTSNQQGDRQVAHPSGQDSTQLQYHTCIICSSSRWMPLTVSRCRSDGCRLSAQVHQGEWRMVNARGEQFCAFRASCVLVDNLSWLGRAKTRHRPSKHQPGRRRRALVSEIWEFSRIYRTRIEKLVIWGC